MKKFEYKEMFRGDIDKIGELRKKEIIKLDKKFELLQIFEVGINELGKQGWELVQVNMVITGKVENQMFYLKREME